MIDIIAATCQLARPLFEYAIDTAKAMAGQPGWSYDFGSGTRTGRAYHYHHVTIGALHLRFSEQGHIARLREISPATFLRGDNAVLLSPAECRRAIEAMDASLGDLALPPLSRWKLARVDFAHDFSVDAGAVDAYLRSFAKRNVRQPGHQAEVKCWDPGTVLWSWKKANLREITIYDKTRQCRDQGLLHLAAAGTLRFEVRLKGLGCNALADELLRGGPSPSSPYLARNCLPVESALDPRLAHTVLWRYWEALDLGIEVGDDRPHSPAILSGHSPAYLAKVDRVAEMMDSGRTGEEIKGYLARLGHKDPAGEWGKIKSLLHSAGVVPGAGHLAPLPGLRLPRLDQYASGLPAQPPRPPGWDPEGDRPWGQGRAAARGACVPCSS